VEASSLADYHSYIEWTKTAIPCSTSRGFTHICAAHNALAVELTTSLFFSLHLRQRLIERIFEGELEQAANMGIYGNYELEGFVNESVGGTGTVLSSIEDHLVTATVRSGLTGEVSTIRA
jgi:hypothetical protein